MILWTIKLISTARRAVAGRKYPHQLAWAVAFGLLLGVVPHGNLLAMGLLLLVLSLKINHAMVGLTAVGASFVATKLDPYSHEVGTYVLTHPGVSETATNAWQLPLVPWTDLNNTVVMGSFLIGIAALIPIFVITYPLFRFLAPSPESDADDLIAESAHRSTDARLAIEPVHQVILVDQGHASPAKPHQDPKSIPHRVGAARSSRASTTDSQERVDFVEVRHDKDTDELENRVAVETRIDVIRMKDYRGEDTGNASQQAAASNEQQPMDEALNYLLRQLRDSQQRKAA